ncbi:MAG: methionyl-tRNA formyltransferase [Planctomycetes bacterium]|nr:methionyl-tRNA formyltransferase [Planctomycetota bacterium]
MRLVLMGTGAFALPTFQCLAVRSHQIVTVVTRPVPPASGRQKKGPVNPVRDWALQEALPVIDPADINDPRVQRALAELTPDLLVVCDYGQILSPVTLQLARLGGINLHGSLLPRYRGAAPVNWAIWRGETETGVTVIHMTGKLDAGPCLATARVAIDPDEDAVELEHRLARLGVEPVLDSISLLSAWDGETVIGVPQNPAEATGARRLRKSDGVVDWSNHAQQIRNQVRALKPWPSTFAQFNGPKGPVPLILDKVCVVPPADNPPTGKPGHVVRVEKDLLWVATGQGCLQILRIKPSGKRAMDVAEFLRGHPVRVGDTFT